MKFFKRVLAGILTLLVLITSINIQSCKALVDLIPTAAVNREKTQIIVKYKDTSAKETTKAVLKEELKLTKLESKGRLTSSQNLELLEINSTDNISKVIKELEKSSNIEYAHPNYLLVSTSISDPRFKEQCYCG